MTPNELLAKAATVDECRFDAAGYEKGCFDEFVELLTAAEDGLQESPQDWDAYQNFVVYLQSPNMAAIFQDIIGPGAEPLSGRPAYTAQERKWLSEPRRTSPRPPTLY